MRTNFGQVDEILKRLRALYPEARCELLYKSPFELLVAVILSAQCTDKRVNAVTGELFKTVSTPEQFLALNPIELEKKIYTCGFFRQKAKSILAASDDILKLHNGKVPSDYESLIKIRGVGRKTASVVLAEAFKKPYIAVDTHVFRVARRLGLSNAKTADGVADDLTATVAPADRVSAHHTLIFFGRYLCKAQNPDCASCPVTEYCKKDEVE